jgi:hypothetical protein
MNARNPFCALLRLELGRSSTVYGNPLACLLMAVLLACNLMPALIVWFRPDMPLVLLVHEAWVSLLLFWWMTTLIMECSNSLVRGVWGFLEPLGIRPGDWEEFLATRAIDRGLHFRAKTVMLAVVMVFPMVLNLVLIWVATRRHPPGMSGFLGATNDELPDLAAADIAVAFGFAMIWLSGAVIVLVQGYYGMVSKCLARRRSVAGAVMACGPLALMFAVLIVCRPNLELGLDRVAPLVRYFGQHWLGLTAALIALAVPLQRFCERRFAEQEVL